MLVPPLHAATMRRPGAAAASLLAVLLLACCAKPLPLPPPPAPPAPQSPAARPALHATWSFATRPEGCLATAAAGRTRFSVAVRRNGPIRLSVLLPVEAPPHPIAHFHGPAGAWTLVGSREGGHTIGFSLRRDVNALSRVLMLLSGGVLDLEAPDRQLPRLDLPASGADGQHWFACVQRSVN